MFSGGGGSWCSRRVENRFDQTTTSYSNKPRQQETKSNTTKNQQPSWARKSIFLRHWSETVTNHRCRCRLATSVHSIPPPPPHNNAPPLTLPARSNSWRERWRLCTQKSLALKNTRFENTVCAMIIFYVQISSSSKRGVHSSKCAADVVLCATSRLTKTGCYSNPGVWVNQKFAYFYKVFVQFLNTTNNSRSVFSWTRLNSRSYFPQH